LHQTLQSRNGTTMGAFKNIFTWWEGQTFGTWLHTKTSGVRIGEDAEGNVYYQAKKVEPAGHHRRWVTYSGNNDASRVPPEWFGWLHNTIEAPPSESLPAPRAWETEPQPNLTGTPNAYRPMGALESGGRRASATGDYEAWSPDAA
jgi:NADH:ubiquinone oxidoreductase subunit